MVRSVLLRCGSCGAVNRVPEARLTEHPQCGKCKALLRYPTSPVDVTDASFTREVERWPGVVLVEFWSPRCGVCASAAPGIRELAFKRAGRVKVALVNSDKERIRPSQFRIQGVPTFILYRNGVKINELRGALPIPEFEAWIDSSLGE